MSSPLVTTFAVLRDSEAPHAQEVLVSALEVPCPEIQELAAGALLRRPSNLGQLEVLKRYQQLPPGVLLQIRSLGRRIEPAFRLGLLQGSPELAQTLLDCIRLTDGDEHLTSVLAIVKLPQHAAHASALLTLRCVVDRLYDLCQQERQHGESAALAQMESRRAAALQELDKYLANLEDAQQHELIVEAILVLANVDDGLVRRVLWTSSQPLRDTVTQLLMTSRHPGVMTLICDSLNYSYPHPKAFEAIQRRDDPEFLAHLLRSVSGRLNRNQQENLRQIQTLDWLNAPEETLPTIPPQLQPALLRLLNATRAPQAVKATVEEWMLRLGTPDARKEVAATGLTVNEEMVTQVVQESLNDADAQIQAWAVSQLRKHAVPETFEILLNRLESTHAEVREAARAELASFNVDRVLPLCASLDLETGTRVGQLLLKVDSTAVRRLQADLAHPVRQRKLGAIRALRTLDLVDLAIPGLQKVAEDPDYLVRHAVADCLSRSSSEEGWMLLATLTTDSHNRVREAAIQGLLQAAAEHPEVRSTASYANVERLLGT